MKRILIIFAALCVTLTMAANGTCVGGIYYLLDGEEATVTYTGTGYNDNTYSGAIVIPDTFTYAGDLYTVVAIGEAAFYGCTGLSSITIPSTVWNIDMYAFSSCSALSSVSLGDNIETLGEAAFSDCTSLTTITLPATVWSLGDYVFSGDSALTSITCLAAEPPMLDGEDGFSGVNKSIPPLCPCHQRLGLSGGRPVEGLRCAGLFGPHGYRGNSET